MLTFRIYKCSEFLCCTSCMLWVFLLSLLLRQNWTKLLVCIHSSTHREVQRNSSNEFDNKKSLISTLYIVCFVLYYTIPANLKFCIIQIGCSFCARAYGHCKLFIHITWYMLENIIITKRPINKENWYVYNVYVFIYVIYI